MKIKRPIAISLAPNMEIDDVFLAFKTLIKPWTWFGDKYVRVLEKNFSKEFDNKYKVYAINSGRSALYAILKSLGVGQGDEVIIQAFTCIAVSNSIIWCDAKPVYVDIDNTYNLNPKDLKQKISSKTKVVIIQHTFGIPANINEIKKVLGKRKIVLIEDCAHSLGAVYLGQKVGTFGDVSFFSFGRDKMISSIFGGMILVKNMNLDPQIKNYINGLSNNSPFWVLQQLLHPITLFIVLPFYKVGIGKIVLFLAQKLKLVSKAIYEDEKKTKQPTAFPARMSGGLAILANNQLSKLGRFNKRRKEIANMYAKQLNNSNLSLVSIAGSSWLRFPIRHSNKQKIFTQMKSKNILIGDWYNEVVTPVRKLDNVFYKNNSCPNAEAICQEVLNLPTYPLMKDTDVKHVIKNLKLCLTTK